MTAVVEPPPILEKKSLSVIAEDGGAGRWGSRARNAPICRLSRSPYAPNFSGFLTFFARRVRGHLTGLKQPRITVLASTAPLRAMVRGDARAREMWSERDASGSSVPQETHLLRKDSPTEIDSSSEMTSWGPGRPTTYRNSEVFLLDT